MKVADALNNIHRIGLDSAPIIYYVERNPDFHAVCVPFFQAIDFGSVMASVSTLAITEVLTTPLRHGDSNLAISFQNLLARTQNIDLISVSEEVAEKAASLRAVHHLRTPDAIHLASAIMDGCDSFLTNDARLKRLPDIQVLILNELEL